MERQRIHQRCKCCISTQRVRARQQQLRMCRPLVCVMRSSPRKANDNMNFIRCIPAMKSFHMLTFNSHLSVHLYLLRGWRACWQLHECTQSLGPHSANGCKPVQRELARSLSDQRQLARSDSHFPHAVMVILHAHAFRGTVPWLSLANQARAVAAARNCRYRSGCGVHNEILALISSSTCCTRKEGGLVPNMWCQILCEPSQLQRAAALQSRTPQQRRERVSCKTSPVSWRTMPTALPVARKLDPLSADRATDPNAGSRRCVTAAGEARTCHRVYLSATCTVGKFLVSATCSSPPATRVELVVGSRRAGSPPKIRRSTRGCGA
jgi:hypothetical protein